MIRNITGVQITKNLSDISVFVECVVGDRELATVVRKKIADHITFPRDTELRHSAVAAVEVKPGCGVKL